MASVQVELNYISCILSATITSVAARKEKNNHHIFKIEVKWSGGDPTVWYRDYKDYFHFQMSTAG